LLTTIVKSVSSDPPGVGVDGSPDGEEDGVTGMVVFPGVGPERPAVWLAHPTVSARIGSASASHTRAVRGGFNPSRFLSRNCG